MLNNKTNIEELQNKLNYLDQEKNELEDSINKLEIEYLTLETQTTSLEQQKKEVKDLIFNIAKFFELLESRILTEDINLLISFFNIQDKNDNKYNELQQPLPYYKEFKTLFEIIGSDIDYLIPPKEPLETNPTETKLSKRVGIILKKHNELSNLQAKTDVSKNFIFESLKPLLEARPQTKINDKTTIDQQISPEQLAGLSESKKKEFMKLPEQEKEEFMKLLEQEHEAIMSDKNKFAEKFPTISKLSESDRKALETKKFMQLRGQEHESIMSDENKFAEEFPIISKFTNQELNDKLKECLESKLNYIQIKDGISAFSVAQCSNPTYYIKQLKNLQECRILLKQYKLGETIINHPVYKNLDKLIASIESHKEILVKKEKLEEEIYMKKNQLERICIKKKNCSNTIELLKEKQLEAIELEKEKQLEAIVLKKKERKQKKKEEIQKEKELPRNLYIYLYTAIENEQGFCIKSNGIEYNDKAVQEINYKNRMKSLAETLLILGILSAVIVSMLTLISSGELSVMPYYSIPGFCLASSFFLFYITHNSTPANHFFSTIHKNNESANIMISQHSNIIDKQIAIEFRDLFNCFNDANGNDIHRISWIDMAGPLIDFVNKGQGEKKFMDFIDSLDDSEYDLFKKFINDNQNNTDVKDITESIQKLIDSKKTLKEKFYNTLHIKIPNNENNKGKLVQASESKSIQRFNVHNLGDSSQNKMQPKQENQDKNQITIPMPYKTNSLEK